MFVSARIEVSGAVVQASRFTVAGGRHRGESGCFEACRSTDMGIKSNSWCERFVWQLKRHFSVTQIGVSWVGSLAIDLGRRLPPGLQGYWPVDKFYGHLTFRRVGSVAQSWLSGGDSAVHLLVDAPQSGQSIFAPVRLSSLIGVSVDLS